jgi:hypothetical protein
VGVGDSLEAALPLAGPIKAGSWHLIGDGIVLSPANVKYEVIWRHGGADTGIVQWEHHFDPSTSDGSDKFDAEAFEADGDGIAAAAASGDQLVLRWSIDAPDGGTPGTAFIPNGDGSASRGRIPSLILPK